MHKHSASRVRRGPRPFARATGTLLILAWCGAAAAQVQPPAPADGPDSRAATVETLRAERTRLEATIGSLRTDLARRQNHVDALESEAHDAAVERAALQRRLTGYTLVRTVAVVAVGAALGLTVALLLALSRARDEHRRRTIVVKNSEILRDAVERYRSLGAQLELEYRTLCRQNGAAARPGSAAGALLAGYERERAWVDQDVARSEAAIDEAIDEMQVA